MGALQTWSRRVWKEVESTRETRWEDSGSKISDLRFDYSASTLLHLSASCGLYRICCFFYVVVVVCLSSQQNNIYLQLCTVWMAPWCTSCFQQLGRNSVPFSPDGEMILIFISESSTVLAKCAKINSAGTGVHRPRFKTSHSLGLICGVFNRPLNFSGFNNESASVLDKEADGRRARSGCCNLLWKPQKKNLLQVVNNGRW